MTPDLVTCDFIFNFISRNNFHLLQLCRNLTNMDGTTVRLAGRSASLSTQLYSLGESCGHDNTQKEISAIAGELTLLSTTLWRLHEAMSDNFSAYTTAFHQDLGEIQGELSLLCDEIEECCLEMSKLDGQRTVGWLFKKGRVVKLEKHLQTLKTTVVVMTTVLFHSKEYGIQRYVKCPASQRTQADTAPHSSSDRLAESAPHTMSEDRAILESIFSQNRNAIMDLHNLETSHGHKHASSTSDSANQPPKDATDADIVYSPGAHGRNLSAATGVEVPPVPDVLPAKVVDGPKSKADDYLSRRFSKRGVRLGVHMSILDLGAHETEAELKKKWIAQAKTEEHVRPATSTIIGDSAKDKDKENAIHSSDNVITTRSTEAKTPPRRSTSDESVSKVRARAHSLIGSPLGKAMSTVIRGLSLSNVRNGRRSSKVDKGKRPESGDGIDEEGDIGDRKGPVNALKNKFNAHFTQDELKTPDYNQEFENGL